MDDRILLVQTLDCEWPTAETDALACDSPARDAARRWTRSFEELCNSHGYSVTCSVHPDLSDLVSARMHDIFRQPSIGCDEPGLRPEGVTVEHVSSELSSRRMMACTQRWSGAAETSYSPTTATSHST